MKTAQKFVISLKAWIENREGKILLTRIIPATTTAPFEMWDFPGGRLKYREDISNGLIREVKEETNLNIKIGKPIKVWTLIRKDDQQILILFNCKLKNYDIKLSKEHAEFKWVPKRNIRKYVPYFLK